MTPRDFTKELSALGFQVDSENKKRFLRLQNGMMQYVARESVRGQGNRIFRERHKYCGESLKGKRAAVAARQFACVTEDDL